jgi:uncharacterized protein YdhG (YjbR/CyaY superfamily)
MIMVGPEGIDDYIRSCPEPVRPVLEGIRQALHRAVPNAEEKISYQMPTITLDGQSLVHFAAWKHHIGLYPLPNLDATGVAGDTLAADLQPYDTAKGTARFPLDRPVPYELIERLAARLVEQRQARS